MIIESTINDRGKVIAIFVPVLVSAIAIFSRRFFTINILPWVKVQWIMRFYQ
jgi:hypothetical protein